MRVCTEIYKSCAEIYINTKRKRQCGDKDEDAAEEEDSQNLLR